MAALRTLQLCALVAALSVAVAPQVHPAPSQDAEAVARDFLKREAARFGLGAADLREVSVSSIAPGTAPGMQHVYLQQQLRGIPVWNAIFTVNISGDGSVINPGNRFIDKLQARAGGQMARRSPVQAALAAVDFLELKPSQPLRATSTRAGATRATLLSTGGISKRPIEAGLVWYFAQDIGQLRLSWRVQLEEGNHLWDVFVDAGNGEPLAAKDRVIHERAADMVTSMAASSSDIIASMAAVVAPEPAALPAFASIDGATYTVFPLPFESPADGGRRSVTGAASPSASPYGWHDTDGAAGVESTHTRGNNVIAYTDTDANNVIDANSDPDGGVGLNFSFPMLAGQLPLDYANASVTNLFYLTNAIHDLSHGYGFNEASGNFQANNYGKGGLGGDALRAEDLDGSGSDNANFSPSVDGDFPRMQMYRWNFPFPNVLEVASPAPIAGTYIATGAGFGPDFGTAGAKTGSLVLANDNTGTTSDGCEALVGFPAGAIAVMDRGSCNFTVKVKNAQVANAIAAIIVNNVAGDPITLGGTDATVNIPAGMISLADGNKIRASLPGNATAKANGSPPPQRLSSLDAGVVTHEYGHGISTRLTGGAANASCLDNPEQMGEGWSDFFAAAFTSRASDVGSSRRGMATWLVFQTGNGQGIRNTPYSTSMSINPVTYAQVANTTGISSPHGIGYVWNSMLWEVYWNLVRRYGYNPNLYQAWNTGGNNLAVQLVMDGLKLQPCGPGFVDGRNAILAADTALTGGANQCEIWRGFAKRGLGFSANQGSPVDRSDGVEAYDLPNACKVAVFGGFQAPVAAAPALNTVAPGAHVNLQFNLSGIVGLPKIDTQPVNCSTLEPTSEAPKPLASDTGLQQVGDNYTLDWRPAKAWEGTCRAVTIRAPAASDPVAYFYFPSATKFQKN